MGVISVLLLTRVSISAPIASKYHNLRGIGIANHHGAPPELADVSKVPVGPAKQDIYIYIILE